VHRVLILTSQPEAYRRLVDAAALPDLDIAATTDVLPAPAVAGQSNILLADPARARLALPAMPRLQWTQLTWAGAEPMLGPGLRRDYVLTNVRGVFGPLMSEYVFGYLLAHERRIVARLDAQREGRWDATLPGTLRGKTIGLAGVGSIGAHLAATARHFGMRVHGLTRASEGCPFVDRYFHGSDTISFARGLDYLIAVLPHTGHTRHIIDAGVLDALPSHAVVMNVGRGGTVDEAALAAALHAGRLAGAVLDVFAEEPLPGGHPLWRTPNTFITGHTSAPSLPADVVGVFVDNYRRFAAGEPLAHQVDFERGY